MPDTVPVPSELAAALVAVAEARPMRRGSLTTRFMKCGQSTCACQSDPAARHGPYIEWSRVVRGRRQARYLTAEQAEVVRAQIAAGQEFRTRVEAVWGAAERWADAALVPPTDASKGTAEKGGSRTNSTRRSRRKSPP